MSKESLEKDAAKIISSIEPDDGWYKCHTKSVLTDAAYCMLCWDMDKDVIADTIDGIVNAVRGEYGD